VPISYLKFCIDWYILNDERGYIMDVHKINQSSNGGSNIWPRPTEEVKNSINGPANEGANALTLTRDLIFELRQGING
jgi:hypothetical protein